MSLVSKKCSICLEIKDISSFVVQKATKDRAARLQSNCKVCKNKKYRKFHLKKEYGLTLQQYDQMLKAQGDRCAICLKHQSENYKGLYVDHNHKTGKIRGLLCNHCNWAIGHLQDDPDLVERILSYLIKNA